MAGQIVRSRNNMLFGRIVTRDATKGSLFAQKENRKRNGAFPLPQKTKPDTVESAKIEKSGLYSAG
ncbi:MAG: hypothetical protein ACREB8_04840 [Pseudolabrys sp.]